MKSKFGLIFALWFLALVNYLERVAMSFAGPSIMSSLAMPAAEFGVVLSSFGIGYMLAQIPGGLVADRWGARTLLVMGPIFWALFTGLTGLVSTLIGFVIVRICFGLSEGLSNTSVYKAIGENFEAKDRARIIGICSTAIPIAPALAGAIVGTLLGVYGWQAMFFIMVVPALMAALFCFLFVPAKHLVPQSREARNEPRTSFRELLRYPSLWLLSIGCFAWNIPYWGFLGWMPSYLSIAHHLDLKTLGAVAGLPYVFAFFGLLVSGWLGSWKLDRYCAQLAAAYFVGAAIFLFLAYQAVSLGWAVAGLSGAAFFLFGSSAPIGKLALDLAPERHRAAYVGIYNSFGQVGGAFAPAAIGFLVTQTGTFASGFGLMVAGLGAGAVCLIAISRLPYARNAMPVTAESGPSLSREIAH